MTAAAPAPTPAAVLPDRERLLRQSVPVFVNSFNQPTYLRNTLDWLRRHGFRNVHVVDQASDSRPLLADYERAEAEGWPGIHRLGDNIGPRAAVRMLRAIGLGTFVFTDPDLGLPEPPAADLLSRMFALSARYRCRKVGLALDISEPDRFRDIHWTRSDSGTISVLDWERRFWKQPLADGAYRANVDTTFFLWNDRIRAEPRRALHWLLCLPVLRRPSRRFRDNFMVDIRVAAPGFVARHLPWYVDTGMPEDEAAYYRSRAAAWSTWLRNAPSGGTPPPPAEAPPVCATPPLDRGTG